MPDVICGKISTCCHYQYNVRIHKRMRDLSLEQTSGVAKVFLHGIDEDYVTLNTNNGGPFARLYGGCRSLFSQL